MWSFNETFIRILTQREMSLHGRRRRRRRRHVFPLHGVLIVKPHTRRKQRRKQKEGRRDRLGSFEKTCLPTGRRSDR